MALAALGAAPLPKLEHMEIAMNGSNFSDRGLAALRLQSPLRQDVLMTPKRKKHKTRWINYTLQIEELR